MSRRQFIFYAIALIIMLVVFVIGIVTYKLERVEIIQADVTFTDQAMITFDLDQDRISFGYVPPSACSIRTVVVDNSENEHRLTPYFFVKGNISRAMNRSVYPAIEAGEVGLLNISACSFGSLGHYEGEVWLFLIR